MAGSAIAAARRWLVWICTAAGLALYNWWIAVPLRPGLLRSPNELFSNLEIDGHAYARWMQHADLASGLLLLVAFLVVGRRSLDRALGEWYLLLIFALGGSAGGLLPEHCLDTLNRSCHLDELELRLSGAQYLHVVAGIVEFAAITGVLCLAARRTRGLHSTSAALYRWLWRAAFVAYPLLAVAYLLVLGGAVIEPLFFVGFSLIVINQMWERTTSSGPRNSRATMLVV